ncbi:MAG: ArnT family glycosyltransferase [Vicinamibacterales bacterium]
MTARAWTTRSLLTSIVLAGFAVRLWGLTFGLPIVSARPDELVIVVTALRFLSEGNLNPRFFDYPGLFLYLVGAIYLVYYAIGRGLGWFDSIPHFVGGTHGRWPMLYFLNRFASALFGTLTIVWLYRTARRLFGETAGLLAALFLAFAFLHVRDSHYGTTDAALVFFTVCAIHALVLLNGERRRSHAVRAGIFAGLAMGAKYNSLLLVAPMFVVEAGHAWSRRDRPRELLRTTYLPWMLGLMLVTFLATSPYLIIDYRHALRDFEALGSSMSGGMTPRDLLGPGWLYHVRFSLFHGVGWPMLLAAFAGAAVMLFRHAFLALLLLAYPLAYYAVAGASANVFVRYMLPVVPFVCLFAAYFVDAVASWGAAHLSTARAAADREGPQAARPHKPAPAARLRVFRAGLAAALGLAVVAPSAWSVYHFDRILSQRDNRLVASDWVHEHVAFGSSVFMTGNSYGYPPLEDRRNPKWRLIGWDWAGMRFIENGHPFEGWPDWIVVQRSALPYSHIPDPVEAALPKQYSLAQVIRAGDVRHPANVYDIQDAFYMPYGGFRNIRRPGPNFEIYQRRPEMVPPDAAAEPPPTR